MKITSQSSRIQNLQERIFLIIKIIIEKYGIKKEDKEILDEIMKIRNQILHGNTSNARTMLGENHSYCLHENKLEKIDYINSVNCHYKFGKLPLAWLGLPE